MEGFSPDELLQRRWYWQWLIERTDHYTAEMVLLLCDFAHIMKSNGRDQDVDNRMYSDLWEAAGHETRDIIRQMWTAFGMNYYML
jgi:hypothetical protein